MTTTVHFENLMGMTGFCESIDAAPSTVSMMENMMPKLYKNPQPGPCPVVDGVKPKCQH